MHTYTRNTHIHPHRAITKSLKHPPPHHSTTTQKALLYLPTMAQKLTPDQQEAVIHKVRTSEESKCVRASLWRELCHHVYICVFACLLGDVRAPLNAGHPCMFASVDLWGVGRHAVHHTHIHTDTHIYRLPTGIRLARKAPYIKTHACRFIAPHRQASHTHSPLCSPTTPTYAFHSRSLIYRLLESSPSPYRSPFLCHVLIFIPIPLHNHFFTCIHLHTHSSVRKWRPKQCRSWCRR